MSQAIGILETKGVVTLVHGTDAMLKAANVELTGEVKMVGSAYASATVTGDVAAVQAAIDAGVQAAESVGNVLSSLVIARPHQDVDAILPKVAKARK